MVMWIVWALVAYFGFLFLMFLGSLVTGAPRDGEKMRISAKDWPPAE